MSQPKNTLCSCNCADGDRISLDVDEDRIEEEWTQCECRQCGTIQGCNVVCSEISRIMIAQQRGKIKEFEQIMRSFDTLHEAVQDASIKKNVPKCCGDCVDHGLLELRRQAVQRGRKRRLDERNSGESNTKRATHRPSETTPAR